MKTGLLMITIALFTLFQCSSAKDMRTKRVNACSALCLNHPAIKAMSFDRGGGSLFMLGGGYEKETCTCNRGSR